MKSNIKNYAITACSIHTVNNLYIIKATDCGTEKNSTKDYGNLIRTQIGEIEKKYNKNCSLWR